MPNDPTVPSAPQNPSGSDGAPTIGEATASVNNTRLPARIGRYRRCGEIV